MITYRRRKGYRLSAKLELEPEEAWLIERHDLGVFDLWLSATAIELELAAESDLDLGHEIEERDQAHLAKALRRNLRGIFTALVTARREARLSVAEAIAGKVFEAMLAHECAAAEAGIRAGTAALDKQLELLRRFDRGEEELNPIEADHGGAVPPGRWTPPND